MQTELLNPPIRTAEATYHVKKPSTPLMLIGYIMLLVSLSLYAAYEYTDVKDNAFMMFCVHYFIGIAYTIILITQRSYGIRKSWRKDNLDKTVIAVNLYLISAYALNRELQVFANSVDWFCVYILLSSLTLLSFKFYDKLPTWVNQLQYFLLGTAAILYLYLAVYVANFYPFGAIGILALGIGIHVLVPLTLLTTTIFLFIHNKRQNDQRSWYLGGLVVPLCLIVLFMLTWNSRISKLEKFVNQSVMYEQRELPLWIPIAQQIKNDWISERILKSDLVYTTVNKNFNQWSFMPKTVSWDEVKKHDPLVFLSSLISKSSLTDEERVNILKAISNGRHVASERLWSGDNLTTSYVVSDIDIYTDLHIAYTEKYLNVKNNSAKGSWNGNTQEAIYTFYLPEGSVITSLSLWIDGKESKGILTSKQKAAKAYKTIVGVEQRDPSVVHWQEGNTVTVRIFPCTTNEERKFKIGITSPLQKSDDHITYKNVVFDGPGAEQAQETKRVRFIGSTKGIQPPAGFTKDKKGDYVAEGKYDPDFNLTFKSIAIPHNHFTFDGFVYSIADYKPIYQPFICNTIYLDINNSWSSSELDELKSLLNQYTIYVFVSDERIELGQDNWDITAELQNQNFTLFPFHKIKDVSNTLVVTKGKLISPHLNDIKESEFSVAVSNFFKTGDKINVFNLQGGTSTYISSFKELRGLEFTSGSPLDLMKLLSAKHFPSTGESDQQIILHDANMVITKRQVSDLTAHDNAPDHLARLFAYNDVMRKVGSNYFSQDFINDDLVNEAASAYVVSPVSSLIVLETKEDYKRFDIQDQNNSLQNAAKQSSGAVPEPHEWALIILFALFVLYLKFKL
jgi:XrtN system VIT domain protein